MPTEPVELDGLTLAGERVVGIDLESPEVTDARIEDCDLSGVVLVSPAVRRATVTRTRMRDCIWGGAMLQDVTFDQCPTESLSLRFSTLQRVTFSGCQLAGADFYGATFDKVTFDDCDLSRAHFDHAVIKELVFRSCLLTGITGALDLKGAYVDFDDIAALAPSLAREAGLLFNADGD